MNKAILQQALDALECLYSGTNNNEWDGRAIEEFKAAIQALRTELAKPEPEPVAWRSWHDTYGVGYWDTFDEAELNCAEDAVPEPLFTKEQL